MIAAYSPEREVAIHEAGHAVVAYLLGRPFTSITVVAEGDVLGSVAHAAPGDWYQPDWQVNARVRRYMEDRIMIGIAGHATQVAWLTRVEDAPDDLLRAEEGASYDYENIADHATCIAGSPAEAEAYVEWLRERVRNWTGRPGNRPPQPGDKGNKRFWHLVEVLADSVQRAGSLSWRRARDVLRQADIDYHTTPEQPEGARTWERAKTQG